MSTTLLSAMTAALLTATCLPVLADSSEQLNRISTTSEPGDFQAMTTSVSATEGNDAADNATGYIQVVGRNGSHSMHPNAPVPVEQFADDGAKGLMQTGDE